MKCRYYVGERTTELEGDNVQALAGGGVYLTYMGKMQMQLRRVGRGIRGPRGNEAWPFPALSEPRATSGRWVPEMKVAGTRVTSENTRTVSMRSKRERNCQNGGGRIARVACEDVI